MENTIDDFTPHSDKSNYFDAPIMHFSTDSSTDRVDASQRGIGLHDGIVDNPGLKDTPVNGAGSANNAGNSQKLSRSYGPQTQGEDTKRSRSPQSTNPPSIPQTNGNKRNSAQPESFVGAGVTSDTADESSPIVDQDKQRRTPSLRSLPVADAPNDSTAQGAVLSQRSQGNQEGSKSLNKNASMRTSRSTRSARNMGAAATGAFVNGASLTGPNAEPDVDDDLHARAATAEHALSQRQKDKIVRDEQKEGKRLSKFLKTESRSEKAALNSALSALSSLQELHKSAIKRASRAQASHARALSNAQKAESRFLEEKAKAAEERARAETRVAEEKARWEGRMAEVVAQEERLEAERTTIQELEDRVAESAREVERLRIVKGTDEREREAKLSEISQSRRT